MDQDNQYYVKKIEVFMTFIDAEIDFLKNYPTEKRKIFFESFMAFYDHYLAIKSKWEYDELVIPDSLHSKIISNLKKIRNLMYEKEDYILEMKLNLSNFGDSLMEIYYIAHSIQTKENIKNKGLDEEIRSALRRKGTIFFDDINQTMSEYKARFSEDVPSDIVYKKEGLLELLKLDFNIIINDDKNLGSISFDVVDGDFLIDTYEKIKKMKKGKAKQQEEEKFKRLCEIYRK